MFNQRIYYRFSIFAVYLCHHDVSSVALNQGCDVAVVRAADQITYPMTWHGSVFYRCKTLSDRYRTGDLAVILRFLRMIT